MEKSNRSSGKCSRVLGGVLLAAMATLMGCAESQSTGDIDDGQLRQAVRDAQKAAADAKAAARDARNASRQSGASVTASGSGYNYYPEDVEGMGVAELAFPTGDKSTSAMLLHHVMPVLAMRNDEFTFQYHVTNVTDGNLENVTLTATNFRNVSVKQATPAPTQLADGLEWTLGEIGPRETKLINVLATSSDIGDASACLAVDYSNRLCVQTTIVEPALELTKTATELAMLCDEMEVSLVVTNPGSGVARKVRVVDELPDGLTTLEGRRRVEANIGDLEPGKSKRVTFKVKASKTGSFANAAEATGAGDLRVVSNETVTVVEQPVLTIASECPGQRYLGRKAQFCFTVKNTGTAPSVKTVVSATSPAGAEVSDVNERGSKQGQQIVWQLGTLAPGSTKQVCFKAKSNQAGMLTSRAQVRGECADPAQVDCATKMVGIPAILLEVIDMTDPVEVGDTTTYLLQVTNQGSAPDMNISMKCTLPPQEELVSATGATNARTQGNVVQFNPLPKLDPKAKAEWRVVVKAARSGDVRFAVEMTSDNLTSPVRETEATNLYE